MSTRAGQEVVYRLARPSSEGRPLLSNKSDACLSPDDVLTLLSEAPGLTTSGLAHIERCERCRILVAESLRASPWGEEQTQSLDGSGVREAGGLTTFRAGDLVAERFVTQRFLARGGMGEVYLVFDRLLEVEVALKTLPCSGLDDTDAMRLVKAEVQMARRITDRHVCRILDFGVHRMSSKTAAPGQETAVPFLTMSYLQGETLGHRVRARGGLTLEEFIKYGLEIALGLAAIHEAGVVHRDIKSDNVFLTRPQTGEPEIAVVMDLGLAGLMTERVSRPRVMGTQGYMSPQQLAGAGERDPRDDVFSMGKVLQEMALGHVRTLEPEEIVDGFVKRFGNSAAVRWAARVTANCQSPARADRYATARPAWSALTKLSAAVAGHEVPRLRALRPWLVSTGLGLAVCVAWLVSPRPVTQPPTDRAPALSPPRVSPASGDASSRARPGQGAAWAWSSLEPAAPAPAREGSTPKTVELRRRSVKLLPAPAPASVPAAPAPAPALSRPTFEGDLAMPRATSAGTKERPHPNHLYNPTARTDGPH